VGKRHLPPWGWYDIWPRVEEMIPVMHNPFGAFFGLTFSVTFSFQTIQEIIREPAALKANSPRPITGSSGNSNAASGQSHASRVSSPHCRA